MKHLSPDASLAWKVGLTVLHVLGVAFTTFRLFVRLRMSNVWWDDYLVIIPCLADIFYLGVLWVVPVTSSEIFMKNIWFAFVPPIVIMWLLRLSRGVLALGLARIFPPRSYARRLNVGLAALIFPATMAAGAFATDDICNTYQGTPVAFPTCLDHPSSRILTHMIITAEFASDSLLALGPMIAFRHVRLPRAERRIIQLTLACGVAPCLTPIVFTILHYYGGIDVKTVLNFVCHLTSGLSLTISNLLIVVSSGIRASRRRKAKVPVNSHHRPARAEGANCDLNHKSRQQYRNHISRRAASQVTATSDTDPSITTKYEAESIVHITLTEIFESYIERDNIS